MASKKGVRARNRGDESVEACVSNENPRRSRRLVGDEPVVVAVAVTPRSGRKSKVRQSAKVGDVTSVGQSAKEGDVTEASPRRRRAVSNQKTRWSRRLFGDEVLEGVNEGIADGEADGDVGVEVQVERPIGRAIDKRRRSKRLMDQVGGDIEGDVGEVPDEEKVAEGEGEFEEAGVQAEGEGG